MVCLSPFKLFLSHPKTSSWVGMVLCSFLTIITHRTYAQLLPGQRPITVSRHDIRLADLFSIIWDQAKLQAFYNDEQLSSDERVTVNFKNEPLDNVLAVILRKKGLSWYYREETFVILPRKPHEPMLGELPEEQRVDIKGIVLDGDGNPLSAATVVVMGWSKGVLTRKDGRFLISRIPKNIKLTLKVSCIGYLPQQLDINHIDHSISIVLKESVTALDETVVIAYGTSSRRNLTSSVNKVSSKEIAQQPVSDPLLALQGRMPGLAITQVSGLPGGEIKVALRGRNSIAAGNNLLYIVDGMPFPGTSLTFNNLQSGTTISPLGASNPLNMLNIADIESIEVLKDADATAIYGSRGANGVMLISTKKPIPDQSTADIKLYSGIGNMAHGVRYLDNREYLQMRNQSFMNDGVSPHTSDYDVTLWNDSSNKDWQKTLLGNTAKITDAQMAVNVGSRHFQLRFNVGYRRESTIYPGEYTYQKYSGRINWIAYSQDEKTRFQFIVAYTGDHNKLPYLDLAQFVNTPPNAPSPYTTSGDLNWEKGSFDNPMSYMRRLYKGATNNLTSNVIASRDLWKGFQLKTNLGLNRMKMDEKQPNSFSSLNPAYGYGTTIGGFTYFGFGSMNSWIAEPQLSYRGRIGQLAVDVLVGGTFQEDVRDQKGILGTGMMTDAPAQLENILAASTLSKKGDSYYKYRYSAMFGRINLNLSQRYIINITGRRDGSSRFGSGNRLANFGAVGGAWIFSKSGWVKETATFLSYGKLRGSYGTTGNDQIKDYGYYATYMPSMVYGEDRGQWPSRLYNPNYGWELSKKLEFGLDIGIMEDRFLFTADYYSNRSSNQLVNTPLSAVTGFTSIQDNIPATVQNKGWEIELHGKMISEKKINWSGSFNISFPRNTLTAFPNIEATPYNNIYTVGHPLNVLKGLHSEGVDPATGIYRFTDINRDGILNATDFISNTPLGIRFFGGVQSSISFDNWNLDFLFQFVRQNAHNYLFTYVPPGFAFANQPAAVLDRWQQPGDEVGIQQFTQGSGAANDAYLNALRSNQAIMDASYVRFKNFNISYSFPESLLQKWRLKHAKLYLQGQNLFTITSYKGRDPENASDREVYPPLRILSLGLQAGL